MAEQNAVRVAYLGPKGSFTHQAALKAFPEANGHSLEPQTDFLAVFNALQTQTVDRGVIPIENSTNGFVMPILDLFASTHPVAFIVGETYVPVEQALLAKRKETTLSDIKTLYSHPQAWGQCTPFLTKHLRHAEQIDTTSTSKAAETVAQSEGSSSAAICSPLAAELYGLDILLPNIAEKQGNTTRFLILQRPQTIEKRKDAELTHGSALSGRGGPRYKSLISFTVPHNRPAALADALAVFGKHGINLSSLNSRPSGDRQWNYIFFAEFWGHTSDGAVENALAELTGVVKLWRNYGTWLSMGDAEDRSEARPSTDGLIKPDSKRDEPTVYPKKRARTENPVVEGL